MEQQSTTVARAIDVLFHLRDSPEPQGVTAIANALGQQKSATHRLLATLASRHLVHRTTAGRYALGNALHSLAAAATHADPLAAAAAPVLEQLTATTGETTFLVADRNRTLTVVARHESSGFLRAAPGIGDHIPHAKTAVAKLYAAYAPHRLSPPPGSNTTTNTETRARNYATNIDEWQPGLAVIAVPVVSQSGDLLAALALATVTPKMQILSEPKLATLLQQASAQLSID